MIADMHRLERAARLTMGTMQDLAPEILPRQPAFRLTQHLAILAAVAVALAAAIALLFL